MEVPSLEDGRSADWGKVEAPLLLALSPVRFCPSSDGEAGAENIMLETSHDLGEIR